MKRVSLVLVGLGLFACTKVVVHGRDYPMEPNRQTYSHVASETFQATKKALEATGYTILSENPKGGTIKTNWLPTKATSHYVDLFDHRDYGTVGAYYQLEIQITEKDGKSEVEISAPVRSITHRIKTSHFEEKKVLGKIADLLRREDFELTNVGAEE